MQYFKNAEGGWDLVKILVPLFAMWMAWMTYNGFVTRRLLNLETKLDTKFATLSSAMWKKVEGDNKRHESRIDELYLLIAGGHNEEADNINSGQGAGSGSSSN